jgi:hypothetical protein
MNATNRTTEILLTLLALAGMYLAIPKSVVSRDNAAVQKQQSVLLADGSDPMPFCRGCR